MENMNQSSQFLDSARKGSQDNLFLYNAVTNIAEDLRPKSSISHIQANLRSIDSQATAQEFQGRYRRTQNTIDNDFKTITDHTDVQDLAQRQRIFEDVIIQRIKVI
jgi:hypothetical protein